MSLSYRRRSTVRIFPFDSRSLLGFSLLLTLVLLAIPVNAGAQTAHFSYVQVTLGGGFSSPDVGDGPFGVAVDASGNAFVADTSDSAVKEIPSGCTSASCVKTLGGGFSYPDGVAVDGSGNVFVVDIGNDALKEILSAGGYVTVDPLGGFIDAEGVAVDGSGNVFVGDTSTNAVYEILAAGGYATIKTVASLSNPNGVAVDGSGNVFVAYSLSHLVLKLETASVDFGTVVVGQTSATVPLTFTFDSGGTIGSPVALTQGNSGLDFAVASGGTCTAGTYSTGATCTVNVTFTPKFAGLRSGAVLLQDGGGNTIATAYVHGIGSGPQVAFGPGTITTYAGNGTLGYNGDNIAATSAELYYPNGVAVDGSGNLYIADYENNRIRKVTPGGTITTVAGTGAGGYNGDNIAATSAELCYPVGVAVDGSGNLYIADYDNYRIRKVTPDGTITTVAGTGGYGYNGDNIAATTAELTAPNGVAVDGPGNIYIADGANQRIRKVTPGGTITTVAGTGANGYNGDNIAATTAELSYPTGVAVDGAGNFYIADSGAYSRIRKVTPGGTITTVAGIAKTGYNGDNIAATSAELAFPIGVAVDGAGNLYIADTGNYRIRKVDVSDPPSLTFASTDVGQASAAQDVTVLNQGNAPLTFQPFVAGNLLDAVLASGGTSCTALSGLQLAAGATCTLGIEFDPAQSGLVNGHVKIVDNALNAASPNYATQTIALQGTGIADVLAALTTPTPSSTLAGSSVTFDWTKGTGVTLYKLWLGTTAGSLNLYSSGNTTATSVSVTGLPTYGVPIYATLWSQTSGVFKSAACTYTEAGTPVLAALTTPIPSSTLAGSSVTFDWTAGGGVTAYKLWLGTTAGSLNLYSSGNVTTTSVAVTGLPTYGVPIYATLWSEVNGVFKSAAYTYTEAGTPVLAALTTPIPSSTLAGASVTFDWTKGGGVTLYKLWLGTTVGSLNLYSSGNVTTTSVAVTGLPTNGTTVYATLWSEVNGVFKSVSYTYTAAP